MHALEVIVDRNERAAGREAAQAWNDYVSSSYQDLAERDRAVQIHEASEITVPYLETYFAARKEG